MFDSNQLKPIESLIETWEASGILRLYHDDCCQAEYRFGYADRNRQRKTPENPSYLLSARSGFLQGLAVMQLVEAGLLELDAPIGPWFPEYPPASHVTLRHMLFHESGIQDYYYGHLMLELTADSSHQALDDKTRYVFESQHFFSPRTWQEIVDFLSDTLLFEPGSQDEWSATNHVMIETLIERVSGQSIQAYLMERIFGPLGMKQTILGHQANTVSYVCMRDVHRLKAPYEGDSNIVFTTTVADLTKLMYGLRTRKLLSAESWAEGVRPNVRGEAILCDYRNGFEFYHSYVLGYEADIYIDAPSQCSFFHIGNEAPIFRLVNGEWSHFMHQVRLVVEGIVTTPRQTHFDTYHERNAWDAMHLRMAKDQEEFVIDAKTSLCWALSEPEDKKPYVLMEGYRAIGLMILAINPKKKLYKIDILIVDARYQNRGFGKIMLSKGLEILKAAGATKIDIIVNRFNTAAYQLYLALGFKETGIYEGGVRLSKPL